MERRGDIDRLIDRFVQRINGLPRHRIREEDVPLALREGGARAGLYYDWSIRRFPQINWIESLEERLPAPLPPSYRSLVTRYLFPAFEVGPLHLLANTGQPIYHEMQDTMADDKIFSPVLLKNGFAQFARPAGGGYDPICFDMRRKTADGEFGLVELDHEDLLSRGVPTPVSEIAPSFYSFIEDFLREEDRVRF